jgi:hypothetical protein
MAMQTRIAAVGLVAAVLVAAVLVAAVLVAAVLAASPRLALAQGATVCLKPTSGMVNCSYQTMILCEQAKQPNSHDQCVPRFEMDGTTGSSAAAARQPATARHRACGCASIALALTNCRPLHCRDRSCAAAPPRPSHGRCAG